MESITWMGLPIEGWVAIATIALVVVTGLLWWSTRALVKEARRTAELQLKAYVTVAEIEGSIGFANNEMIVSVTAVLKNSGQTPAQVIGTGLVVGFSESPSPTTLNTNYYELSPGTEFRLQFDSTGPSQLHEQDSVRWGDLRAVVTFCYVDYLGDEWRKAVEFRCKLRGMSIAPFVPTVRLTFDRMGPLPLPNWSGPHPGARKADFFKPFKRAARR